MARMRSMGAGLGAIAATRRAIWSWVIPLAVLKMEAWFWSVRRPASIPAPLRWSSLRSTISSKTG
jgi:hypothetical protein